LEPFFHSKRSPWLRFGATERRRKIVGTGKIDFGIAGEITFRASQKGIPYLRRVEIFKGGVPVE